MKTKIIFRIAVIIFFTMSIGCSKDNEREIEQPTKITMCFNIIDAQTGEPVVGAILHLTYSYSIYWFSGADSFYGTSDANGSVCDKIWPDARPNWWTLGKDHYQRICGPDDNFPPDLISMDYESYIKFEIKNEEPSSKEDIVIVSYKNLDCFGLTDIWLNGIDIDTTIIRQVSPLSLFSVIYIESMGVNPFTHSFPVNVESRDTTLVSILY